MSRAPDIAINNMCIAIDEGMEEGKSIDVIAKANHWHLATVAQYYIAHLRGRLAEQAEQAERVPERLKWCGRSGVVETATTNIGQYVVIRHPDGAGLYDPSSQSWTTEFSTVRGAKDCADQLYRQAWEQEKKKWGMK